MPHVGRVIAAATRFGLPAAVLSAFALIAGVASAPASAAGGPRFVLTYRPGPIPPQPLFLGEEASMSLEVTDAPPARTEGDAKLGDIIAVHQVRAAEAIALLAGVKARHREFHAGAILVRARFVAPGAHPTVWCDAHQGGFTVASFTHDCFEDTKGVGQLDRMWRGDFRRGGFLGFGTSGVDSKGDPMPAPVAYRAATPDERPTAFIGYKYCDGDNQLGPARFRLAAGLEADPTGWKSEGDCRAGVWSDPADKSKVDVDGLHMTVTSAQVGVIHYRLVDRIAPGPVGPIVRYAPLHNVPLDPAEREAALKSALVAAGEPFSVVTGPVAVGQVFARAPVKYGLTGRLRVRVQPRFGLSWPKGTSMDVGQPVFGVPSDNGPGDGIAWCRATKGEKGWQTACLLPISDLYQQVMRTNQGYYWRDQLKPALAPTQAAFAGGGSGDPASADPVVERAPIDSGPPMTMTVKLEAVGLKKKSDARLSYAIEVDLDWGEGPQRINRVIYTLPDAGQSVRILGQWLSLRPADNDQIAVERLAVPGDDPVDLDLLATK